MRSKVRSPHERAPRCWGIYNQIRGLYPWPTATTDVITGEPVKLWGAQVVEQHTHSAPGSIVSANKEGIDIACGDGQVLHILELQASGKKRMTAAAYLAGNPIQR